jgi:hypothetical protein
MGKISEISWTDSTFNPGLVARALVLVEVALVKAAATPNVKINIADGPMMVGVLISHDTGHRKVIGGSRIIGIDGPNKPVIDRVFSVPPFVIFLTMKCRMNGAPIFGRLSARRRCYIGCC